jgi:hypothetical protein
MPTDTLKPKRVPSRSQMHRTRVAELRSWATSLCLLEHLASPETLTKAALIDEITTVFTCIEVEEEHYAYAHGTISRSVQDILFPPKKKYVPKLDGVQPWFSLVDDHGHDVGVVVRDTFYVHDATTGGRWCVQTPGSFFVAQITYHHSTDAVTGRTYRLLPAAQQYGLRLQAWVEADKHAALRNAAALNDIEAF